MEAVWPSGREDRGSRELVLWELRKGMMVPAAALGRTEIPGKAEGIPEKGLEVTWRLKSQKMDQEPDNNFLREVAGFWFWRLEYVMEVLRVCETGDGQRSAAIVQRIMEVDDEEEVLELDKESGWERRRDADALFEWGDFR